jgi:hypothetical protein
MNFVIRKNTDTDTNACIAGAYYGAKVGYNQLLKECPDLLFILENNPFKEKERHLRNSRNRLKWLQPGFLYNLAYRYYILCDKTISKG